MNRLLRYWNRMRHGLAITAALAVVFCLVVITHGQQNWTPTQKGSYGRMTRDALDRLLASAEELRAGDPKGAQQLLQGMQGPVDELTTAAGYFREQANRESDRCVDHIKVLENRVAEIYQEEQQVKGRIDELDAQLVKITEQKKLTEDEITKLKASVLVTEQKLEERRRKLEELERWWWVPFYNLYLGIRTLVDDDIGNYNSLKNTLDDASIKMSRHQQEFQAARAMKEALSKEIETMRKTHAGLQEMRVGSEAELGDLKKSAVFLTDAGIFWKRVSRLLKINVSDSVQLALDIRDLESEMTKENTAPQFNNLNQRPVMELYESLAAFADTIDQGKNFLEAEGTDFCGGPRRPANGPTVSSACNIEQFTQYYEITDPKTCAFRYLNPPGCPPRARPVIVNAATLTAALAAAKERGTWVRAANENWVDRQRCDPDNSIYYGKVQNQEACEQKCMSDGACVAWTFNREDDSMGEDSIKECWGRSTRAASPRKPAAGFASGGIAPRPGGVECSIFDDGYTNLAGPSNAIFFNTNFQACIAGPSLPKCRKWFGRCTTTDAAAVPVNFQIFDDNYTNMWGPNDKFYFTAQGQACTTFAHHAVCRKWFGRGVANDGRKVLCRSWGEAFRNDFAIESNLFDMMNLRFMPDGAKLQIFAPGDNNRWNRLPVRWGGCEAQ